MKDGLVVVEVVTGKDGALGHNVNGIGGGADAAVLRIHEGHWAAERLAVKEVEFRGDGRLLKKIRPLGLDGQLERIMEDGRLG